MNIPKLRIKNSATYRYLFRRDTLLATILVFLLIGLFAKIEKGLGILDPKETSSKDFSYTDLAYKLLKFQDDMPPADTNIVVVNIGDAKRPDIVRMMKKMVGYGARLVAVDILFDSAKNIPADTILKKLAEHDKRVVMAYSFDANNKPGGYFYNPELNQGYVNFTLGTQNVIRNFVPFISVGKTQYVSFSAAVVKVIRPSAYDTLFRYHNYSQIINYRYKENNYPILNANDILNGDTQAKFIKHKIVLLGYVSLTPDDCTDRHFTPMNDNLVGKGLPDMNGIFIHANIIRMMLNRNYVHQSPSWLSWLVAFLICWVHMAFFIGYFIEKHIWFHLAAKIAQLISAIFFLYLGLFVFFEFNIAIDLTGSVFAIVFAVDVLYFYEAGVLWLHCKKGYQTPFHHESHHDK